MSKHRRTTSARGPGRAADQRELPTWHSRPLVDLLADLDASEQGLSQEAADARLQRFGRNELPHRPPPTVWQIALRQFQSPLIYVLGAAAIISLLIQEVTDAAFIAVVLGINALIGTIQEWKAEQSSQALQKLLELHVRALRDGELREVAAEALVPGDVVVLESGNRVPADIRLFSAHGLEVDESLLTGESLPVHKTAEWSGDVAVPLADHGNMLYAGSVVSRGRGRGVVAATGADTAVGRLALDVIASDGGRPPLIERMERFTRVIGVAVLLAAVAIGGFGVALERYGLAEMFLFMVALVVSAIPEGLPVALTVVLSNATSRMARRGVIVRRLTAVEGLGSCTMVATDKTGTLTRNELTVRRVYLPTGEEIELTGEGFAPHGHALQDGKALEPGTIPALERLACTAVLCNEASLYQKDDHWVWHGDTVDVALLAMARKIGWDRELTLERHPQRNEIPFEPEYQFAASYNAFDGGVHVFVKGSPERVLAMCEGRESDADLARWHREAARLASSGYRVLALAEGVSGDIDETGPPPSPERLGFRGFAAMIDPLRAGVVDAIRACHQAGIEVVMVTGDHRDTALAIARELGLAAGESQVLTGGELAEKSPEELRELVRSMRVFARVAPHQKLQIVNAAREAGHYVAVTGDGINDAPALRQANIGVAMGKSGTGVAREASELVISDDDFTTIVAGIEEGRTAFDNVRKVIYLLISTGGAEIVLVGLAVLAGLPLPLLPVQLLWLNLVTNGIQHVGLAFEPGEDDNLTRKPRPVGERIFNRLMVERTAVGSLFMGTMAFAFFSWTMSRGEDLDAARNQLLLIMVLFENLHLGNCRSETRSAFTLSPLRSPFLVLGAITALLLHVTTLYVPWFTPILGTQPVPAAQWALIASLAVLVVPVMELHKLIWWLRGRRAARREHGSRAGRAP